MRLPPKRWLRLRIVHDAFGERGRVDEERSWYGPLTLGGYGIVMSSAVVVRWSAMATAQFIALTGHANDGADGQPLAPTMELPF